MSATAAYLRAPPAPPNDPTFVELDGQIGWRIAPQSTGIEVAPSDCALTLQLVVSSGTGLTATSGNFGGLVPPSNVTIDADCNVWLLDRSRGHLRRFDACKCAFITLPCTGGLGSGARQLVAPAAIAACGPNLLLVDSGRAETATSPAAPGRILVYTRHALGLRAIWQPPAGATIQPWYPVAAACDERGRVLVADPANGAIHVFERSGIWRGAWTNFGAVAAIAVDCFGRIYTYAAGDTAVRLSDNSGKQIGTASEAGAIATFFPPCPIASDAQGRINLTALCPSVGWLDPSGHPTTTPATTLPVFPTAGTWYSEPLDSTISQCQWHRIVVRAQLPARTSIAFATYTSEVELPIAMVAAPDTAWAPVPPIGPGALEALILSPPGRYLWLKVTLTGPGNETPRLERLKVEYPRISLRRYLPAAFAPDPVSGDFTDRLLAIFDQGFRSVETTIDNEARLFDPRSTPATSPVIGAPDMLSWLASWIGVTFDRTWPVPRRRRFLRASASLIKCRGTVAGLRRALLLYLGLDEIKIGRRSARCAPTCAPAPPAWSVPPLILEHWKLRRWLFLGAGRLGDAAVLWGQAVANGTQLDANARLGSAKLNPPPSDSAQAPFSIDAYAYAVFLPARFGRTARDRAALKQMIATETPAYVRAVLRFVQPRMRIGIQSSIGFDSVVGCWPEGVILGNALLGRATVLGPGDPTAPVPRIGRTSRVGTTMRVA